MTQKELLYLEDAIMHEKNIVKIIELSIKEIKNNDLLKFMKNEKTKHENISKLLIAKLEENIK